MGALPPRAHEGRARAVTGCDTGTGAGGQRGRSARAKPCRTGGLIPAQLRDGSVRNEPTSAPKLGIHQTPAGTLHPQRGLPPVPQPGTIIWDRQNLPPFPSPWDPQTPDPMVSPGHWTLGHLVPTAPSLSPRAGRGEQSPGCAPELWVRAGEPGLSLYPSDDPKSNQVPPTGLCPEQRHRGKECSGRLHPITQVDTRLGCPCHPGGDTRPGPSSKGSPAQAGDPRSCGTTA